MSLTPTDITPGVVVTNGKGRFRLVTRMREKRAGVIYLGTYVNTNGRMFQSPNWSHPGYFCDLTGILLWSTRLATPEERAEVVKCLNPKGIE